MWQSLKNITAKEIGFQLVLLTTLFFLYSFDKHSPEIGWDKFVFFLHYVLMATIISYVFLPLFFYKKKYIKLIIALIVVFLYAYFLEEYVLEKLFYEGNRGKYVTNIFYTLIDIIPMLLIIVSFKLAWDASKKQRQVEALEMSVKESELRFLKSQINPHFLFNNLNNLYAYAIENSKKTPSIILELSSVLRYMLYDCKEDFVPLNKEIEHLKNFTALNELQIESRGEVKFTTNNISENYKIAPLILMVFIENAFKHSTSSQSEEISIRIDIHVSKEGVLQFKCENSFLNNSNINDLSKGIGLENVRKRLELLYPNEYELQIEDKNNTYVVNLSMQLKE